MLYNIIK